MSADLLWRGLIILWERRYSVESERRSPHAFSFHFFSLCLSPETAAFKAGRPVPERMARLQLPCVSFPFSVLENREEPRSLPSRAERLRTDVKSRQLDVLRASRLERKIRHTKLFERDSSYPERKREERDRHFGAVQKTLNGNCFSFSSVLNLHRLHFLFYFFFFERSYKEREEHKSPCWDFASDETIVRRMLKAHTRCG